MSEAHAEYYVPEPSHYPVSLTISIFLMFIGGATALNGIGVGPVILGLGFLGFVLVLFGWFGAVIGESEAGKYKEAEDVSFRMGMMWFIFSEVMFFAAFFGALYYARMYSVPWLSGEGSGAATNQFLWPDFVANWPLLQTPSNYGFQEAKDVIGAWGIPAWNTAILLTSGFTVTMAHWALKAGNRRGLVGWLAATVALGIYGATFFMLTGFHGFHVSMGTLMLFVILMRSMKGHFTPKHHFAFEAVAWYWHFVDVVWIGLFIFVYWI